MSGGGGGCCGEGGLGLGIVGPVGSGIESGVGCSGMTGLPGKKNGPGEITSSRPGGFRTLTAATRSGGLPLVVDLFGILVEVDVVVDLRDP